MQIKFGRFFASSNIFAGAQTEIWPFLTAQSNSVFVSTTTHLLSQAASFQAFCSIANKSILR